MSLFELLDKLQSCPTPVCWAVLQNVKMSTPCLHYSQYKFWYTLFKNELKFINFLYRLWKKWIKSEYVFYGLRTNPDFCRFGLFVKMSTPISSILRHILRIVKPQIWIGPKFLAVSYTHLTLPTNREV